MAEVKNSVCFKNNFLSNNLHSLRIENMNPSPANMQSKNYFKIFNTIELQGENNIMNRLCMVIVSDNNSTNEQCIQEVGNGLSSVIFINPITLHYTGHRGYDIPNYSDQLRRSHAMQYRCGYCKLEYL